MKFHHLALMCLIVVFLPYGQNTRIQTVIAQANDIDLLYDSDAVWSPDGRHIAFVSGRSGNFDIWSMEPDGEKLENLTVDHPGYDGDIAWSPDGRYIAFSSDRSGNDDIWMMETDDSIPVNLTGRMASSEGYPRWSPDGRHIAFVSGISGQYSVWVMARDGSHPKRISPPDGSYFAPSWLDDETIIFQDRSHQSAQVWKATIDGLLVATLTPSDAQRNVLNVEASSTARQIAFTNRADGDIWVIDADGTTQRNLTSGKGGSVPVWSLDGRFIAFHSLRDGTLDVWIMESDGSDPTNLTQGKGGYYPSWSPDNAQVVFTSDRAGNLDVWIVNVDGSNPVNLTGG